MRLNVDAGSGVLTRKPERQDLAMRLNADLGRPVFKRSADGFFGQFVNHTEKLRAFLQRLDGRRAAKRGAAGRKKKDLFGRVSWLGYCTECSLDAYTLEDALHRQKQIVAALAGIIDAITTIDWSAERKQKVLGELRRDQAHHNQCILNIEAVLLRNETVKWR